MYLTDGKISGRDRRRCHYRAARRMRYPSSTVTSMATSPVRAAYAVAAAASDHGLMGDTGQVPQVEPAQCVGASLGHIGEVGNHGGQLLELRA